MTSLTSHQKTPHLLLQAEEIAERQAEVGSALGDRRASPEDYVPYAIRIDASLSAGREPDLEARRPNLQIVLPHRMSGVGQAGRQTAMTAPAASHLPARFIRHP